MAKKVPNDTILQKLGKSKRAVDREKVEREMEMIPSHGDLADASIRQILNDLLDRVWNGVGNSDLSELNTISSILQRLLASSQQVAALRSQLRENGSCTLEEDEMNGKNGLDPSSISQLERQLKLL